jgi:hypothetical protein
MRISRRRDATRLFSCEFGVLNRFAFLTQYDDADKLAAERARLMQTENPYGIGAYLGGVTSTAFKPLSFAQPIVPGEYGPFYEIRTYTIAPGGLPKPKRHGAKSFRGATRCRCC